MLYFPMYKEKPNKITQVRIKKINQIKNKNIHIKKKLIINYRLPMSSVAKNEKKCIIVIVVPQGLKIVHDNFWKKDN